MIFVSRESAVGFAFEGVFEESVNGFCVFCGGIGDAFCGASGGGGEEDGNVFVFSGGDEDFDEGCFSGTRSAGDDEEVLREGGEDGVSLLGCEVDAESRFDASDSGEIVVIRSGWLGCIDQSRNFFGDGIFEIPHECAVDEAFAGIVGIDFDAFFVDERIDMLFDIVGWDL